MTLLLGADLSARRQHTLETIQAPLLTVNFYLVAIRWPLEFGFDDKWKCSRQGLSESQQQAGHVIHNSWSQLNSGVGAKRGDMSWQKP